MFNPAIQTKVKSRNNLGLFAALALAVIFGFTIFSNFTLTGAVMMESGEVSSFEPVFVFIAGIIILIFLSILWWWLKKKK